MTINTSRKAGFTLVEIMIVVAIIGLLAAIAIPNFVRARQTSQTNACINNLRQIDGAIQQYLLENKTTTMPAVAGLEPYLKKGAIGASWPSCPATSVAYAVPGNATTAPVCPSAATFPLHVLP
jgi:prepilin-type N-terminal cleavage/methylation domain-containing protein